MTFKFKFGNSTTSVSIPETLLSLYYVLSEIDIRNDRNYVSVSETCMRYIQSKLSLYPGKDTRHLSKYLQECIIKDLLDKSELKRYSIVKKTLEEGPVRKPFMTREEMLEASARKREQYNRLNAGFNV